MVAFSHEIIITIKIYGRENLVRSKSLFLQIFRRYIELKAQECLKRKLLLTLFLVKFKNRLILNDMQFSICCMKKVFNSREFRENSKRTFNGFSVQNHISLITPKYV